MLREHCIFCWQKKEGRIWLKIYMSRTILIRENYLVVFVVLVYILEFAHNMSYWNKYLKSHGLPKFASGPPLGGGPDEILETMKPYP